MTHSPNYITLWPCRVIRLSKLKFGLFLVLSYEEHFYFLLLCLLVLLFIFATNILELTVILLLLYTYTYTYIYFSLFGVFGLVHRMVLGKSREESQAQFPYCGHGHVMPLGMGFQKNEGLILRVFFFIRKIISLKKS